MAARGWARSAWLVGGATAMGFGIWSMHYIGMLAFHLPVPIGYDWRIVLLSLLAAILASGVALYIVSREKVGPGRYLTGSLIMCGGISAMHYVGTAGMRLAATTRMDTALVALSIVLAVLASFAALRMAFRFRKEVKGDAWYKIGGAVALGLGIPAMHYTGMAAAKFAPSPFSADLSHAVGITSLSTAGISAVTFIILGVAVLTSWADRRFAAQTLELHRSDARYRQLFERSLAGVYRTIADGQILDCNDACSRIFGYASRTECLSHAERDNYLSSNDKDTFLATLKERGAPHQFRTLPATHG